MGADKTYILAQNHPFIALEVGVRSGNGFKEGCPQAVKVFSTRTVTVCNNEKLEKLLEAGVKKGWVRKKLNSGSISEPAFIKNQLAGENLKEPLEGESQKIGRLTLPEVFLTPEAEKMKAARQHVSEQQVKGSRDNQSKKGNYTLSEGTDINSSIQNSNSLENENDKKIRGGHEFGRSPSGSIFHVCLKFYSLDNGFYYLYPLLFSCMLTSL